MGGGTVNQSETRHRDVIRQAGTCLGGWRGSGARRAVRDGERES